MRTKLAPPAAGEDAAGRYLSAAAEAKALAEADGDATQAAEARVLEGKALLQAAMAGAPLQEQRVQAILATVRGDGALPAKVRLEVVRLSEIARLRPLAKEAGKFLPAYEASLRSLIQEFPSEPGGYDSLVRMAENHPEENEAVRIAGDILKMSAPAESKAAAQAIVERQALVGRPLLPILAPVLGAENAIVQARGHGIILYSWSAKNPGSLKAAANLAKSTPESIYLVGVNLDADEAAAKAAAQEAGLAGGQVYDARGSGGALAQALRLTRPGEVYVADPQGILRTVSAGRGDLTTKLGYANANAR